MKRKLMIDMGSLRKNLAGESSDTPRFDGILRESPNRNGLKTLRELATFRYSCRHCDEAPCILSCPAEALQKDASGVIQRSTNLCVGCKSCVVICPFGTIMNDFFEHLRTEGRYLDLDDAAALQQFIDLNPQGAITWVEMEADPTLGTHSMGEDIIIKEASWDIHEKPER